MAKENPSQYSAKEAERRTEAALRAAFSAPHKPQSEMKLGKAKVSRAKKPTRRGPKPKKTVG